MATVFYLVRHAAHDGPPDVLVGRSAVIGLSAEGRLQADGVAERLCHAALTAILTSPSLRCQQTAQAIAARAGLEPGVSEALEEIDFGRWAGSSLQALAEQSAWQHWNCTRDAAGAPGGEAMVGVQARAVGLMEQLRFAQGAVALVSHGDIIKALVAHTLGLSLQSYERFDVDVASITTLVLWDGGGKVAGLNERAQR